MNRFVTLAIGASALAIAGPAVAATDFITDTANSSISVLSNPTFCLGSCSFSASLAALPTSFVLNPGQSTTFTFANIVVGSGFGVGSATLDAELAFLTPGGSASTAGSSSYTRIGGFFTPGVLAGTLTWATPSQTVTAGDGSVYTVSFQDLAGVQFGSTSAVSATVTLVSGAVPEPATWAMMILGLGCVGTALRRRTTVSVRYA